MSSRRVKQKSRKNKNSKKNKTFRKNKTSRKNKTWITAVGAAESVYNKTGSYEKARTRLRNQSLMNARKLFGSIG